MAKNIVVIGGGAAGLMAAGQAAGQGASVVLLEKMNRPGRKLRITGKGRGNLTNTAPLPDFIEHFGSTGKFLRSSFHQFFNTDLLDYFAAIGVGTVEERGGRVFPASNQAEDVVERMARWVREQGVKTRYEMRVTRLLLDDGRISGVEAAYFPYRDKRKKQQAPKAAKRGPEIFPANAVIIATGGASYPATGSTGDGYRLAEAVGHKIIPVRPALVPLETAGSTAKRLQGLSLRNVRVTVWVNDRKWTEGFGEMLFTHFGVSGPIVLTISREVVDALRDKQKVHLTIDLKPALDDQQLEARLLRDLDQHGKQQFHTLLKGLLPRKLIPVCCDLVGIPEDKVNHQITAKERKRLRHWLKNFQLDVVAHRPFKEAIITAGGVATREVDPNTMASRLVEGLYFAGEVLDIDADTGGYNLQAAFSSGWVAGRAAAEQ